MRVELRRFALPLSPSTLAAVLADPNAAPSEPTGFDADLSTVHSVFVSGRGEISGSSWDALIAEPLHRALRHLPRRLVTDMRLWQWLAADPFAEFVWTRWYGAVPDRPSEVLTDSLGERFLGTSTLRGVSRNALARLFWCADALHSGEDYSLTTQALENQDFFQAMFERAFGLYPPAVRACLEVLDRASETERRSAARKLNHYLTTITLEALDENDVRHLLAS